MGAIIVRHRRWFSVVNKIQSLDHDAGPRANGDIAAGTGPGPGPGESDSEATALGGEGWIAPTRDKAQEIGIGALALGGRDLVA